MKLKMFSILLFVGIIFSACGGIDYTNAQEYIILTTDKINELDEEYLNVFQETIDTVGVRKSFDQIFKDLTTTYSNLFKIYEDEAESIYNDYKKDLDSFTSMEDFYTLPSKESLNQSIETYNEAGEKAQELFTKIYDTTLSMLDKVVVQINELLKDATKEDLEDFYNLSDIIDEYMDENGLSDDLDKEVDGLWEEFMNQKQ